MRQGTALVLSAGIGVGLVGGADAAGAARKPARAPRAAGVAYRAPDGAFTCRLPAGWKARAASVGGQPVTVLVPGDGGARILLFGNPAASSSIREVTRQGIAMVMQSFPGVRPVGAPKFSRADGAPAAEVAYEGELMSGGSLRLWGAAMLKDGICLSVLSMSRPEDAGKVETRARELFRSMRYGKPQPGGQLARAIVGRWSYYTSSSSGIGTSTAASTSVSKTVTFYPNGRFEYVGGVSSSVDLPSDIGGSAIGDSRASGTYRLRGSTLTAQFDGGGQATFRLELVRGGALKINGMLFIRE
jgi:hypothetical protein